MGISGMLKHYTARTARAAIAMALGGAARLAGCDQIETRIDRAREIADAAVARGLDPQPVSGRQEQLENLVNRYV